MPSGRGRVSTNRSGDPDSLAFPLPPSSSSFIAPGRSTRFSTNDDENSSSSVHAQPPATTDIALTAPPPDRIIQTSPVTPPHSASAPCLDNDKDEEMPGPRIPVLVTPIVLLSDSNVRLKPVLTWWPSKFIKPPPFTPLDRSFVHMAEQIYSVPNDGACPRSPSSREWEPRYHVRMFALGGPTPSAGVAR